MKIIGKIKSVVIDGRRYAFLVNDKWLSMFLRDEMSDDFKKIVKSLKEGQEAEFEVKYVETPKWKGYNIVDVLPVVESKEFESPGPSHPEVPPKHEKTLMSKSEIAERKRECSIILQTIMKAAAYLTAHDLAQDIETEIKIWERCIKEGVRIYKEIMGEDEED